MDSNNNEETPSSDIEMAPEPEDMNMMVVKTLGRYPATVSCPNCGHNGLSKVTDKLSYFTGVFSIVFALIFWPLFWIPVFFPQLRSTHHRCASCGTHIGIAKPLNECFS